MIGDGIAMGVLVKHCDGCVGDQHYDGCVPHQHMGVFVKVFTCVGEGIATVLVKVLRWVCW